MKHASLADRRPWLSLGILAAGIYLFRDQLMLPGLALIILKGAACFLFAVYALRWRDGRYDDRAVFMNAGIIMLFAAIGDMAIELSFIWGGAAFFLSHLAAMTLYLKNLRVDPSGSQKAAATALLLLTPLSTWLITRDISVTLYALSLGGMASCAWISRFPRYRVGVGAVLFVASDLLIFAAMAGHFEDGFAEWLVWPIYISGQLLIVTGIVQTLRKDRVETRLAV